jgi:hypothetical protein
MQASGPSDARDCIAHGAAASWTRPRTAGHRPERHSRARHPLCETEEAALSPSITALTLQLCIAVIARSGEDSVPEATTGERPAARVLRARAVDADQPNHSLSVDEMVGHDRDAPPAGRAGGEPEKTQRRDRRRQQRRGARARIRADALPPISDRIAVASQRAKSAPTDLRPVTSWRRPRTRCQC